ncbi:MAG: glucuronide permease, partial [Streptococcus salivarius]
CGVICYGAYWNGKHKENFHLAHHVIRIGIALILTILLALI